MSMRTVPTRRGMSSQSLPAVPSMVEMDPEIWSYFSEDLLPQVLSHLPWWSNMQLRSTSTSWNALLSDVNFLANCPTSNQRAKPCFTSLTVLQNPEVDSEVDILVYCMSSKNYNPENSDSVRSTRTRITIWSKRHAFGANGIRCKLEEEEWASTAACCDASICLRGKFHTEFAPTRGIFFCSVQVLHRYKLLLINPFNSSHREIPPVPPFACRCSIQSACIRYGQMVADDENPKNVKVILSHFAYGEMNEWTLLVYDLVKGSWSAEGEDLPADLHNSYLKPTSIALLSSNIYVLVQAFNTTPRLLCFMGNNLSDYPLPQQILDYSPNLHVFGHRSNLMLARVIPITGPFAQIDIWRSKTHKKQENSTWERVAVMPKMLLRELCVKSDTREFVKFYVDGDFMCFKPSQRRRRSMFVILLDLLKWTWEFITSDDGIFEGFFICQPKLEIVL